MYFSWQVPTLQDIIAFNLAWELWRPALHSSSACRKTLRGNFILRSPIASEVLKSLPTWIEALPNPIKVIILEEFELIGNKLYYWVRWVRFEEYFQMKFSRSDFVWNRSLNIDYLKTENKIRSRN